MTWTGMQKTKSFNSLWEQLFSLKHWGPDQVQAPNSKIGRLDQMLRENIILLLNTCLETYFILTFVDKRTKSSEKIPNTRHETYSISMLLVNRTKKGEGRSNSPGVTYYFRFNLTWKSTYWLGNWVIYRILAIVSLLSPSFKNLTVFILVSGDL